MKIFLLKRLHDITWGEYDGHIVIAKNEANARQMANNMCGAEGEIWSETEIVECSEVIPGKKAKIILSSFNSG